MVDVIIAGGGVAGLSAALVLGRCRRRVLVCDAGRPRNAASRALHGFLTRDGIPPLDLLRLARRELAAYDTVEIRDVEIVDAVRDEDGFLATLATGDRCRARKLLVATGVVDRVPPLEGLAPLYGRSVFHCPYCDAWEVRDQPLAAYGRGRRGAGLALELTVWSRDLVLLTDGPADLDAEAIGRLARHGIAVRDTPIARLDGRDGRLERVVFTDGTALARRALFLATGQAMQSGLAARLGCELTEKGVVRTAAYEKTRIPGLYVAGDASGMVQLAIVAAAEGAQAAFAINTELTEEDLQA
ncbi:MAG TPA: NAD(P)/FAD-dependent oxidoreductase [Vicinamibacterales bacterium]|nr:NAD(P)/FAD-dependent oxidoreductase [Vicinamibacterales bacterium]